MKVLDIPQGSPEWFDARRGVATASEFHRFVNASGGLMTSREVTPEFEKALARLETEYNKAGLPAKVKFTSALGVFVESTRAKAKLFDAGFDKAGETKTAVRFKSDETRAIEFHHPPELSDGAKQYAAELVAESIGWLKDDFAGSPDIERGHQLEAMARNFLSFEIGEDVEEVGFVLSDCGRYGSSPDGMTASGAAVELKCPDFHTHARYLIDGGGVPDRYRTQVHGHMFVTEADHCWFESYVTTPKLLPILVKVERDSFTDRLGSAVKAFCEHVERYKTEFIEQS